MDMKPATSFELRETASGGLFGLVPSHPEPPSSPRPTRILVVDDQPMNVEILRISLGRIGYEVLCAGDGREALHLIGTESPDLVLLDVMMPELSGLDVLRMVRDQPETADLPVILVTGLGETEDIVEGMQLGANDYITKPINFPILQARLASQNAVRVARDALKRTAARLAAELKRQEDELRVAQHVQRSLLPRDYPESHGLTIASCYEPATEVGGDLYDVVPLSDDRTFLFLADAMGHGVQGALVAASVKATLWAHLAVTNDLCELMGQLDVAVSDLFEDRYVTATACIVDPPRRLLTYAHAGHPPILIRRQGMIEVLSSGGLPLGTSIGLGYRQETTTLEPDMQILLYSDGLTEAIGHEGQLLGIKGLTTIFASIQDTGSDPSALIGKLRRALQQFRSPGPPTDDLTILAACLQSLP